MDPSANSFYEFGPFRLEPKERLLLADGQPVAITAKAFDMLLLLVENSGHLLTKEEMMSRLWPDSFVEEANLTNNISLLRKALGETDNGAAYIQTVPRVGYRFVASVRECRDQGSEELTQTTTDVLEDLKSVKQDLKPETSSGAIANSAGISEKTIRRSQWDRKLSILTLASVAALATVLLVLLSRPSQPSNVVYTQITSDGQLKFPNSCLFTDGNRLYFTEIVDGKLVLAQVSVAGGETVLIPTSLPNPVLCDISPSGSELIVAGSEGPPGKGPLWVVPLPGGSPHHLSDTPMGDAHWSPDGRQLAYEQGKDLYLAKSDASEPGKIATVPGDFDGFTAWSPDGSRLRFTVDNPKTWTYSLWEVAADGTNLHFLLPGWNNPVETCCGKWTPDGRYFLFEATHNGRTDIWAIREKGSLFQKASPEPVQLTAGPISFHHPVSSKDGRKVFVMGQVDRAEIMRLDNSGEWVPYLLGISADGVSFSRDGNWVAYTLYPEGTLWRSKVDGSQRQQLTFPPMLASRPSWSPDGKQIAFMARVPGTRWSIHLVSADGGTSQRVFPEDLIQNNPDWSPDGTRLAFGATLDAGGTSPVIQVLDLRTNQAYTLPGSDGLGAPRWSPDGRYLAAMARKLHELKLFDLATGRSFELAHGIYHFPHWSQDSQYVYIESSGNDPAMIRIRISDHKIENLVSLKQFRRLNYFFGGVIGNGLSYWSGVAPDGSLLVLRDLSSQEIYSFDLK